MSGYFAQVRRAGFDVGLSAGKLTKAMVEVLLQLPPEAPPSKDVVVQHLGLLGQMFKTRDINAAWNGAKRQVARARPARRAARVIQAILTTFRIPLFRPDHHSRRLVRGCANRRALPGLSLRVTQHTSKARVRLRLRCVRTACGVPSPRRGFIPAGEQHLA